jgi:hypothetical protein
MAFLRAQPWAQPAWWARLLASPLAAGDPQGRARLLQLLRPAQGGLMWRSAKLDVAAELQLPQQQHHVTGARRVAGGARRRPCPLPGQPLAGWAAWRLTSARRAVAGCRGAGSLAAVACV